MGWQIDPFGHSREHASILKQLGFEGLVIGRLDYRDKKKRIEDKNIDFLWKASDNLDDSKLFTTMFPEFYVSPTGFCFDVTCTNDYPIIDDVNSPDYNLDKKVTLYTISLNLYYFNRVSGRRLCDPHGPIFTDV